MLLIRSEWVPKKLDSKPVLVLDKSVAERVNEVRARPN